MKEEIKKFIEDVKEGTQYKSVFTEQPNPDLNTDTQSICPNCFANNAEEIKPGQMHCNNCGWEDTKAVFASTTAQTRSKELKTY